MAIRFVNSLTKKKEEFLPRLPSEVSMYTCGVTVYDDCHVGHARSLYIFYSLKKYLEYRGYKVKMVRNITDVDDKIINRAREEKAAFDDIRQKYIANYYRDLKSLEIDPADFEPKATENIHYMVDHIRQLIAKGAAYEVDGDVYFSVRSFANYGALSGQSLDEMLTGVRIDKDEKKRDPLDFALWKKSKEGEPLWESPWGKGRPGWHIECSTMSMRYLRTQTLDIHAGGRDLIFPHHENEIAQAEALTGHPFARLWLHHGLLTIDGRKMSKSLGNFITVQEVLKKFSPTVIKLFFLGAHYGSPIDFTYKGLEKTRKASEKIQAFIDNAAAAEVHLGHLTADPEDRAVLDRQVERFKEVMDDDFNTAQGLAVLFDIVATGNKFLSEEKSRPAAVAASQIFLELGGVLGLSFKVSSMTRCVSASERVKVADPSMMSSLSASDVEKLMAARREARQQKNFRRADEIREILRAHGVIVEDTGKV